MDIKFDRFVNGLGVLNKSISVIIVRVMFM